LSIYGLDNSARLDLAYFPNRQPEPEQAKASALVHWTDRTESTWKIEGVGEIFEIKQNVFGITYRGHIAEAIAIDAHGAVVAVARGASVEEADTAR